MKCKKCKFWNKETDFSYPANFDFGKCERVMLFWDATKWNKDYKKIVLTKEAENNLAFVQDGSDYMAELITIGNFGCVQFEPIIDDN